ncbi:Isopentenyl-diphosphate delta-isomerase, FMN-dependent [Sandaracinus amylolyticus]|uniref:Isopentenyl-diphosphate delta-isomerase n=1 Tax=Sandaracinus amylolyticus TaxID=927083 RepID=A0A0F6W7B6_9BACT|nr:Isopentenyl-diphosphate delta-isomerase, FMN-dependent [Sandaracinus amylolyticus]
MGNVATTSGIESARELISTRKDHHLDLCLRADVGSRGPATGLGGWTLEYDALPEVDLEDVDLSVTLFGKKLRAPILVGAMTGGTDRAGLVNRRLARAAARCGLGMALGSQRAMIVRPELGATFDVRASAPELPLLIANVGAVQLNYGVGTSEIRSAIERVGADAIDVHLNALQEAIQPEGDTRFKGLIARLEGTLPELGVPAIAKEVGAGISERAARKIARLPFAGVEVAGTGGTSWARVESHRAPAASMQAEVGERLAGFGVSTAESVRICRRALGDARTVIASGGVRHGMDVAVAIALGADAAALAKPLLAAADESEDAVVRVLETLIFELKVIAFCCGARDVAELRAVRAIAPGAAMPGVVDAEARQ